ncbi:MAG TPA: beta-ketoacyl-ACP synthase II [Solirubrobacterales bacterium]|nr:beta-ketoacyl-ACP synthase II [Solirubrobacterales bacterium]
MNRRVVITGTGAVTPLGVGADTLIDRWADGQCGISDGVGACREFDPLDFLSRKESRRADRFTQLAVVSATEALEQAGWASELPYPAERIGCIIGTGIGGIGSLEDQGAVLRDKGAKSVSPLAVPLMMSNAATAAVAMRFGLMGETYGVVSACAAGAHAIGAATRLVQSGQVDAVVTGGSESAMTGIAMAAFASMGATSPSGISRPFDARRDGFVMGEGAGVMVIENAESAAARGAGSVGEILGYGATCDAHHLTAPDPSGVQSARAIRMALDDAGLKPEDLDYVNAHGTSTPLNDRSETDALKLALGPVAKDLPISSTKSAIGHLMGAAGAVEAVATVAALRCGVAPPTVGWEQAEEGLDLDYVPGRARNLTLPQPAGDGRRYAISNSFGFGGHNAVLCLAAT